MFTSVAASISADPLANLLSAAVLLVLVRRLRERRISSRPPPDAPRWAVGTGVLLGLGVLTKLGVGIFLPLALGVAIGRSRRRRARDAALIVASVGMVVLPWLVHQVTTYGWLDPLAMSRHAAVVVDQPRFAGLSVDWLGRFVTVSFHSFWAQFGWMGIVAPDRLYWIWGGLVVAGAVGVLRRRDWLGQPAWLLLLTSLCAAVLAYIGYNLGFEQFQGRYLFTALVPIGMLLVAGWAAWVPRRWGAWSATLVGAMLVGLNAYALVRVLVPGFAPSG
jgi:4-amino-4-deoxy-L-arabinose transferase-like glycosyltransferase